MSVFLPVLRKQGSVSRRIIPLFAMTIPAGPSSPIEDYIEERIDLGDYLTPKPDITFLVRVEGESMLDAGILSGDLLVVERGSEPQNGDVVIALTANQFTVKRFRKCHGKLFLVSGDPEAVFPEADFTIWGIVRYAIHKF